MRSAATLATNGAACVIAERSAGVVSYSNLAENLGGAQHSQRVLDERLRGENLDSAQADVAAAAVRVDQVPRRKRPGHHVHAEVAPGEILFKRHVRPALDREIAVPDSRRALAPRQGDVHRLAIDGNLQNGKRGTHEIDPADLP